MNRGVDEAGACAQVLLDEHRVRQATQQQEQEGAADPCPISKPAVTKEQRERIRERERSGRVGLGAMMEGEVC